MNPPREHDLRIERIAPADELQTLAPLLDELSEDARNLLKRTAQDAAGAWPLWGAWRGERMVAAVRFHLQPAGIATARLPALAPGEAASTDKHLLNFALADLPAGVRLVQALAGSPTDASAELWRSCGFRQAAELVHLVSLRSTFPQTAPSSELTLTPLTRELEPRLIHLLEQTYTGSLDCRAIEPIPAADMLENYRGLVPPDAATWLIASDQGGDVGCLLLADQAQLDQMELVYLGVTPAARGRKIGRFLTRHAQWRAAQAGRRRLTLAVDAANGPALDIYTAVGFIEWDRRVIFALEVPQSQA